MIEIKPVGDELDDLFKNAKNIKPKHKLNVKQMEELNDGLFK